MISAKLHLKPPESSGSEAGRLTSTTERLPAVTLLDLRVSRSFRFGARSIQPYADFFNIANADAIVNWNYAVGNTYRAPSEIAAPRIIRVGLGVNF